MQISRQRCPTRRRPQSAAADAGSTGPGDRQLGADGGPRRLAGLSTEDERPPPSVRLTENAENEDDDDDEQNGKSNRQQPQPPGSVHFACTTTRRDTIRFPSQLSLPHNENVSVLSLIPRLSTRRYPQHLQRSIVYLLPTHELSCKPAACRCCCRSTGQTDGRTPDRYIDLAPRLPTSSRCDAPAA